MISILYFIPKNLLSFIVGLLVQIKWPLGLAEFSVKWFVKRYKINLSEAKDSNYQSIGALFTRKLKSDCRPLSENFYVHPADAEITQCGEIRNELLFQAKGKTYKASDLIGGSSDFLEGGSFLTYYLCPTDYHRVHSPVSGEIIKYVHSPGRLWPVNSWSVSHISQLFSINERVAVYIQTERGVVVVVMVGATNVGRMTLSFEPTFVTNSSLGVLKSFVNLSKKEERNYSSLKINKGDELGVFNMGSTVITLNEKQILQNPSSFFEKKVKVKSF